MKRKREALGREGMGRKKGREGGSRREERKEGGPVE